jgi:hypothetical protein
MPSTVTCNFTIPASGSRLQGAGFGATTPRLNNGDSLQIVVTWAGSNPPNSLNGYFVFSPAPDAGANQTAPSPFLNGNNYLCFQEQVANKSASGQQYTFTSFAVPTDASAGNYELTLVVEDARATPSTQWSEDPEFDTPGD